VSRFQEVSNESHGVRRRLPSFAVRVARATTIGQLGLKRKFEILRLLVQSRDAMPRLALCCVLALATACGSDIAPSPTLLPSSSPTPVRKVTVDALVVSAENPNGGLCIAGATVEVTAGQSAGKRMTVTDMCDVWGDSSGGEANFTDLTGGVPMTLRASATGYLAQEKSRTPSP
jgi:hypothetical protein